MKFRKIISVWLVVGLLLVFFQIVIGGITRLTGSGLSITKWDIIFGTLPPIGDAAWEEAFGLYKSTPQYKKINEGMILGSIFSGGTFKFIYFWEYFHRLWARSMGMIFLIPFVIFAFKKAMSKSLMKDLGVVVGLATVAAVFGWIMVASGLVDRPWVNAYKLSIHLLIGVSVFAYLLWSFLKYNGEKKIFLLDGRKSSIMIWVLFGLLCFQIVFGGIMSGMKAALIYPTWPDIGGDLVPKDLFMAKNLTFEHFLNYDRDSFVFSLIHFLHRGLAYVIGLIILWYVYVFNIFQRKDMLGRTFKVFSGLVLLQVIIGIMTLLKSIGAIPLFWGVLHQGVAVLVVGSFVVHMYYVKYSKEKTLR